MSGVRRVMIKGGGWRGGDYEGHCGGTACLDVSRFLHIIKNFWQSTSQQGGAAIGIDPGKRVHT